LPRRFSTRFTLLRLPLRTRFAVYTTFCITGLLLPRRYHAWYATRCVFCYGSLLVCITYAGSPDTRTFYRSRFTSSTFFAISTFSFLAAHLPDGFAAPPLWFFHCVRTVLVTGCIHNAAHCHRAVLVAAYLRIFSAFTFAACPFAVCCRRQFWVRTTRVPFAFVLLYRSTSATWFTFSFRSPSPVLWFAGFVDAFYAVVYGTVHTHAFWFALHAHCHLRILVYAHTVTHAFFSPFGLLVQFCLLHSFGCCCCGLRFYATPLRAARPTRTAASPRVAGSRAVRLQYGLHYIPVLAWLPLRFWFCAQRSRVTHAFTPFASLWFVCGCANAAHAAPFCAARLHHQRTRAFAHTHWLRWFGC